VQAGAVEPYSIEPVTVQVSAYLPASVVQGLDPQGSRLVTTLNGLKTTMSEVWWARSVPTQDSPSKSSGLLYGNLKVGGLVGVIHFLADVDPDFREDFRDQKLRPGYYTMRYAPEPEDKEHKEVSPYRDFLVLSPVSVDREPDKVLGMDELLKWSRLATRSRHPAVLSLVPAGQGYKNVPVLQTDDAGTCTMHVRLHSQGEKSGPSLDLAIILITPRNENGES
jgi:hypothetical protein